MRCQLIKVIMKISIIGLYIYDITRDAYINDINDINACVVNVIKKESRSYWKEVNYYNLYIDRIVCFD